MWVRYGFFDLVDVKIASGLLLKIWRLLRRFAPRNDGVGRALARTIGGRHCEEADRPTWQSFCEVR